MKSQVKNIVTEDDDSLTNQQRPFSKTCFNSGKKDFYWHEKTTHELFLIEVQLDFY